MPVRSKLLSVVCALLAAAAASAHAGEPERAALTDTTVRAVLAGDGVAATRHFNSTLAEALSATQISDMMRTLHTQVGQPSPPGPVRHGCEAGHRATWQRIVFERAVLDAKLVFDEDERIAGLFLVPVESEKPCAEASSSQAEVTSLSTSDPRETAVTVGAEGWPLPALLTLPKGEGPHPAVVLVHGSGPHDADETVFASKPFRDLAHRLADQGVASLRYVKRSKQHGPRMLSQTPDFGVDEEVTDDAVAALQWLGQHDAIAARQVVVLGHSLGALLAPRICRQAGDACAGTILLAAPSRPAEDLVMEQVRYLAKEQGISDEQVAQMQTQADQVKRVQNGESAEGPLMLGLSASYWRSLGDYDPLDTARQLRRPMLILQGERDYQVTMVDLDGWRDALKGRDDIRFKVYPRLDHLFMAGDGPSTPAEYMRPRHVDASVITDIAAWIQRHITTARPESQP